MKLLLPVHVGLLCLLSAASLRMLSSVDEPILGQQARSSKQGSVGLRSLSWGQAKVHLALDLLDDSIVCLAPLAKRRGPASREGLR